MNKLIYIIVILILFGALFGCTADTKSSQLNDLNTQLVKTVVDLNNLQNNYITLQTEKVQLLTSNLIKDQNITSLQYIINILNVSIAQKTLELNNLQSNFIQLQSDKNKLEINNVIKDQNYLILIQKINDLNIQILSKTNDLNNTQTNYNNLLSTYNTTITSLTAAQTQITTLLVSNTLLSTTNTTLLFDMNTVLNNNHLLLKDNNELNIIKNYNTGGFIDNDFNYCALTTLLDENGVSKYAGILESKKIRLYNNINNYFNTLYSGEYYDENTINERTNNYIQNIFLDNIYLIQGDLRYSNIDSTFALISLVQRIPYDHTAVNYDIAINKYPYNVLYNKIGICAEKSYLMALLLSKLGYGTGIFLFTTHATAGIKCLPPYDYKNSGYCLIESTQLSFVGEYQDSNDPIYSGYEGFIKTSDGKEYEYTNVQYADYHSPVNILYSCQ